MSGAHKPRPERPILFSGPMVRAILEGRKTQTRRVVKPLPFDRQPAHDMETTWLFAGDAFGTGDPHACARMPYQPGDVLWVRETWTPEWDADGREIVFFRADAPDNIVRDYRWRPSIFMPRKFARLFLPVTAVRVERLQEISEDDCYAEGTLTWADEQDLRHSDGTPAKYPSVRHAFRALWDSLNAKRGYGWSANPWVWVIEFERREAPRVAA